VFPTEAKSDVSLSPPEWLASGKEGRFQKVLGLFLVAWSLFAWMFHMYCAYFGAVEASRMRTMHLTFFMVAGFLFFPLKRKRWHEKFNWFFLIDLLCILLVLFIQVYILWDVDAFVLRSAASTWLDKALGIIMIILVLEATRRAVGLPLVVLSIFFLVHAVFADHFFWIFEAHSTGFFELVDYLFIEVTGIYGIPIMIMAAYVTLFILFGAFLLTTGGARFFTRLAISITGRLVGGPAKAAVVSSSLMATISGSTVGNVVTTGSFTIPLMKSTGFPARIAGAIESVASTGGQFMPPVMGAAAFIMAYFLGVTYLKVCFAAAIPATLYYVSVYFMIHFEAKKRGFTALPSEKIPNLWETVKRGYQFLVPVAAIVYFLVAGYSPTMAAFWAITTVFIVSFLRKETRLNPQTLLKAITEGVRLVIPVSIACAAAGIIIGTVTITGLGSRLATIVIDVSGGHLAIVLILTMIISILLGMGLVTTVVYITLASTIIPAMVKMGVIPMAAHLFALYFGVMSNITPPVALAAYAGAGLAGSNPMQTGFTASKYGIAGFLVPFLFVYRPALVLQGSAMEVIWATFVSILGVFCLAGAIQGWLLARITILGRLILFIASLCFIVPIYWFDCTGLLLLGIALLLQWKVLVSKFTGASYVKKPPV
jgi:TRAP transporter 4TM/12TM fusion protein